MLFRQSAAAKGVEDDNVEDQSDDVAGICAAVDALVARGADFDVSGLQPEIGATLKRGREFLAVSDEQSLRQTVGYSIQASEAMAATARITGEVRDTDGKVQTIAGAIEELTASIDQIAQTSKSISESMARASEAMSAGAAATTEAADASRNIGQSFHVMTGAAEQLASAAAQIATFVETIEGLANQTNLLALNVTIEAARAGEAGRGFAVVAAEVKQLSGQTRRATDDIRARIERLERHVHEVMQSVTEVRGFVDRSIEHSDGARAQIEQVRSIVDENTSQMADISHMLDQQSQAVSEIAQGVSSIAEHSRVTAGYADQAIAAVGASEKLINEQFADLDRRSIPNFVLHRAKADHVLWKKRLSEMLVGLNSLKPTELSDHHQCRLGKWYDVVSDEALRRNPAFIELEKPHEAVHRHGRAAAQCYTDGDHERAKAELAEMERASELVLQGLDRLLSK